MTFFVCWTSDTLSKVGFYGIIVAVREILIFKE